MREFQAKRKVRKLIFSRWVIALLIILFLFLVKATWSVYKKSKESAANVVAANKEYQKLTDRETLLNSEISRLSTEQGVEEEIRNKYSVSKPGEQVLVIIDDQPTSTPQTAQPEGWWAKFKNLFK